MLSRGVLTFHPLIVSDDRRRHHRGHHGHPGRRAHCVLGRRVRPDRRVHPDHHRGKDARRPRRCDELLHG